MSNTGLIILVTIVACATALPFRHYQNDIAASRPVHPMPSAIDSYLANYLQTLQEQQQLNRSPYVVDRPQPLYQQGYIQEQAPNPYAEAIAALLPYRSADTIDYPNYDYSSFNNYNNDDGIWYDDAAVPPIVNNAKRTNDDLALAQLYIDSLNGKYSVEDLETLVREATYHDNTENQLHELMEKKINDKKSVVPQLGSNIPNGPYVEKKGQKEEVLMVPSSSLRGRNDVKLPEHQQPDNTNRQDKNDDNTSDESQETTSSPSSTDSETESEESESDDSESTSTSTMSPYMKSAYEALKGYLDRERYIRQEQDEGRMPQKRFISDPESLTKQLSNLKKTNKA